MGYVQEQAAIEAAKRFVKDAEREAGESAKLSEGALAAAGTKGKTADELRKAGKAAAVRIAKTKKAAMMTGMIADKATAAEDCSRESTEKLRALQSQASETLRKVEPLAEKAAKAVSDAVEMIESAKLIAELTVQIMKETEEKYTELVGGTEDE